MDAHADADRTFGERLLRLAGGRQRPRRGREGDEEGVALGVDLDPAVAGEGVA
jgi:hypothetical protein